MILHQAHKSFDEDLLNWYLLINRDLPWRKIKDPFKIWLSEIILQQTRVSQGLPYYQKFVYRFDNVFQLAEAEESEILKLWQGLGYYSRARNIHTCAKTVVQDYEGKFPESYQGLLKLKGIGRYTAAAIASICFDEKTPAIDGNAFRVLARIFGLKEDISLAKSHQVFYDTALQVMPKSRPGDFNQAIMDLGATICLPKSPNCDRCPVSSYCFAFAKNLQAAFPVKSQKLKIKERDFSYHILQSADKILLKQRTNKDIWAGLYEFLLLGDPKEEPVPFHGNLISGSTRMVHQLTHQKLNIRFYIWHLDEEEFLRIQKKLEMRPVEISEIGNFAVPKPIELFLKSEYLLVN